MTTEQQSKPTIHRNQQYVILGALALVGVALLLIGNSGSNEQQHLSSTDTANATVATTVATNIDPVAKMEQKLAHTLSQVQGAGTVTVQITVKHTGRKEYAVDTQRTNRTTTEESGDTHQQTVETQEQITVVQQNQNGTQQALLVSESSPEIAGVLVVAEGACDAVVREQLLHAVTAVLQVPMYQVMVVPGEEHTS